MQRVSPLEDFLLLLLLFFFFAETICFLTARVRLFRCMLFLLVEAFHCQFDLIGFPVGVLSNKGFNDTFHLLGERR